jgi:hypothetical protein
MRPTATVSSSTTLTFVAYVVLYIDLSSLFPTYTVLECATTIWKDTRVVSDGRVHLVVQLDVHHLVQQYFILLCDFTLVGLSIDGDVTV